MFQPQPNPQGKGLVPVLQDLESLQSVSVSRKSAPDFLRDYCVSSMILGASFRFKPVVGRPYFLYAKQGDFSLSLIAPHEWGDNRPGDFLAKCELRADMTWQMNPAEMEEDSTALEAARVFIEQFVKTIVEQESIGDELPFYVSELPYYQRMLMTALASSLRQSMPEKIDEMQALLKDCPKIVMLPHY